MDDFLNNPAIQVAVQGGVAPFVVALVVALALARTRFAWLAIVAGYATQVALSTGFSFTPFSASRKILLLCLAAPVLGLVADALSLRGRAVLYAIAALVGVAAVWVFITVLGQKEGSAAWLAAAGTFAFVAVMVGLLVSLRNDPLRAGAAGL